MAKLYELNGDKVAENKFGVQATLIITALEDKSPDTVKGVADRIKDKLQTRQTPERVVNFYLSMWKKKGIVSVVGEADETPVSTGNSNSGESTGDNAPDETIMQKERGDGAPVFDLANCTIKEAVLHMVDKHPNSTILELSEHLQVAGRTVTPSQIADATRKLVKSGDVLKNEEGQISLNE